MSQTNYKYNPDEMSEEEFLSRFVVRGEIFDEIFEELQVADYSVPNQHYILLGQRGQGKTTILRKLKLGVEKDKKLNKFLIPVKFSEEQYRIRELTRLWEEVAEHLQTYQTNLFPDIHDQLENHFDDENYATKCFGYLEKVIKKSKKKILLLVDNIDIIFKKLKDQEQHRFREILLTSSSFIIVGTSTKMFEQQYDYSKPFYEFFKLLHLSGLNSKETIKLLKVLGNNEQTEKINKIIKENPARIETLKTVTGGVPRTIVMLFDIFVEDNGNAFNDLRKVLDEVSPLYLARMEISEIHQDIVHTIALNWDGMLTKDIAKKTRLISKVVSAQLKLLEKHQIIESISLGKNKIYQIKERFFNIWYLMRYGRKKDRDRVEWLIKFLLSWYDRNELKNKAKFFIKRLSKESQNEAYVYHFGEALCYTGLDLETDHKVKQSMKEYLTGHESSFAKHVSYSDIEIIEKAYILEEKNKTQEAIDLLINSKKESPAILCTIAIYLHKQKYYDKAESYYLKAIESGNNEALFNLGYLYQQQKHFDKAENYYLKAIESGINYALNNLGILYKEQKHYDKAERCYLKAIESDDNNALNNLGNLYQQQKHYDKAERYFLKAIESGDNSALINFGLLYKQQKRYDKAERYFLKAIKSGDNKATGTLAWMYFEQTLKPSKALQLIKLSYKHSKNYYNTLSLAFIELWVEDFSNSYKHFEEWLEYQQAKESEADVILYLNLLMSKGQFYQAKEFFELPKHQLKERYKPLWYALMTLMQDDFPHEIKKMGSELKQTVDEILKEIEKLKRKYTLS